MIIGREDIQRVARLEGMVQRMLQAQRWLSEFDDALKPMWDYLFGNKRVLVLDNTGQAVEIMEEHDIGCVREKLRSRLGASEEGK